MSSVRLNCEARLERAPKEPGGQAGFQRRHHAQAHTRQDRQPVSGHHRDQADDKRDNERDPAPAFRRRSAATMIRPAARSTEPASASRHWPKSCPSSAPARHARANRLNGTLAKIPSVLCNAGNVKRLTKNSETNARGGAL